MFSQFCHPEIVGNTRGLYQCLRDLRVGAFILLDFGNGYPSVLLRNPPPLKVEACYPCKKGLIYKRFGKGDSSLRLCAFEYCAYLSE